MDSFPLSLAKGCVVSVKTRQMAMADDDNILCQKLY
jgi:hypothetical protein